MALDNREFSQKRSFRTTASGIQQPSVLTALISLINNIKFNL